MTWTASATPSSTARMPLQGSQRLTLTPTASALPLVRNFFGAREAVVVEPAIFPSVKLDEVEFFDAEIGEAFVDVRFDVVRRITIVEGEIAAAGPLEIFGRNFRGDVKFLGGVGAENFSEDLFAAAFAVGPCGVKEIAAEIDGALQGVERFGFVGTGPAGESPHAVTNFTDVPSGAAELAIMHESGLL